MLAPYSDNNSTSGLLTTGPEEMRAKIKQAWRHGWQVVCIEVDMVSLDSHSHNQNVHAIGDRANHIVLNIFEDIQSEEPKFVVNNRPRIEHSQIMTLGDLERSGRLGGKDP